MKIHICLISDQILANLIPALMERPDRVVLVVSNGMTAKKHDRRLKKILDKEGMAVEIYDNAPDTGLSAIHEFAFDLRGKLEAAYPNAEFVFNATGGTKLMALGFVEFFRGMARHVIYTDTAHKRVEYLPRDNEPTPPAVPMSDVLDVPYYLSSQGFQYQRATSDNPESMNRIEKRKAAAKYLARHASQLDDFFGAINLLASKAFNDTEQLSDPRQNFKYAPNAKSPWAAALRELKNASLIGWQDGSTEIVFTDSERTHFLRGGWLEEYAYHILHDEGCHDARLGTEVSGDIGGLTKNEFDVLATHGNQLLFIECKTLRFNPGENDNELGYKLDSLGKAARGLFGQTWLLSARPSTPQLSERLRVANIRFIGPDELPKLRELVQKWMKGDE